MCEVQPILFCTAIDNLIKGGLQFNESEDKWVKIYMENEHLLYIEDNGVGLSNEDFIKYCNPYINDGSSKKIKGLDLNIAVSIILEHTDSIYIQRRKVMAQYLK